MGRAQHAPGQPEDHQPDHRQTKAAMPFHPAITEIDGNQRTGHRQYQQPMKQPQGQIPDSNPHGHDAPDGNKAVRLNAGHKAGQGLEGRSYKGVARHCGASSTGARRCHRRNTGSAKNITSNSRATCSAVTSATDRCSASAVRLSSVIPPGISPRVNPATSTSVKRPSSQAPAAAANMAVTANSSTRSRNAGALRKNF